MKDKIIQTITLKIGGKEISVSKEDAKKLYAELHEFFGEKHPVIIPQPYPVYRERDHYRPYRMPDITCHAEERPYHQSLRNQMLATRS